MERWRKGGGKCVWKEIDGGKKWREIWRERMATHGEKNRVHDNKSFHITLILTII